MEDVTEKDDQDAGKSSLIGKSRKKRRRGDCWMTSRTSYSKVIADYGHTMRTLKPTEYIAVAVDLTKDWGFRESGPAHFIMKMKKGDLDRYDRGDFDVARLRERVEFLES